MRLLAQLLCFFLAAPLVAQSADGVWYGALDMGGGRQLRLQFTIRGSSAILNSLDQGGGDIPASHVESSDGSLTVVFAPLQATLVGKISGDTFEGNWVQRGNFLPLKLERRNAPPAAAPRPQESKQAPKQAPYAAVDVTFDNREAKVRLAGTLTEPRQGGPFPAVVLVSGSGPEDRDETVFGHKPFLVLADYLTRRGIAVLRVDDRGVGGSTGNPDTITTEDNTADALAAVDFLASRKEIDAKRIGLVGHSEGGLVAPLAATRSPRVAFIVLLAGPGVRGAELMVQQSKALLRVSGAPEKQIAFAADLQRRIMEAAMSDLDEKALRARLHAILDDALGAATPQQRAAAGDINSMLDAQMKAIASPWFRHFLRFDPAPVLKKVRVPVLALNGSKDVQVPAKENLAAIAAALRDNPRAKTMELPGLNHLFQTASTGAVSEYANIQETFAPSALKIIGDWIAQQVKK